MAEITDIKEQLTKAHDALRALEKNINSRKEELGRVHRDNLFNRRFSAMLSSYSDFETVGLRLERTIKQSQSLEHEIQVKMRGLKDIPDEIQPLMRDAHRLTKENQADFKGLYIFAKIFLDEYTSLLGFLFNWRGISTKSITSFYSSLTKYQGEDEKIIHFKTDCIKRLKAVDVFITQYRDKFIVHDQTEHKETRWFLNDMRGGIRFLGGRPSVTPPELAFVVAGYVTDTSNFSISHL